MEVGKTFGTGLPAPSEEPPRLNFAQNERCSLRYWPACSVPIGRDVSICLFADDAAVLAQGANLKYTQCTLQRYLHTLESWLTDWRIAINVDKTQAIVFRKHRRNIIPKTLSLFDEDIEWVNVVRYLGLFLDSSLTYRQHTKYICDKFWTKIHLSSSLIGRRSPLSLKNKVLLYKQVLRPVLTYAAPVWGAAAPTTIKKSKLCRIRFFVS
ncbi:RNA-directed DNA polymerase from mobile element jockey [Trichonephila clavipes]|nr:RNA-directed DNA polymerase from mobile element jockey [Trichonephila clavipes]